MWSSMSVRTAPAVAAAVTTAAGCGGSAAGLLLASLNSDSSERSSAQTNSVNVEKSEAASTQK